MRDRCFPYTSPSFFVVTRSATRPTVASNLFRTHLCALQVGQRSSGKRRFATASMAGWRPGAWWELGLLVFLRKVGVAPVPEPFTPVTAALRATVRTTREEVFRRFHLNEWCGQVGSWIPWGLWESRADPTRVVEPRTRIVAGSDGSASANSTALIGCTVQPVPHVFVLALWEHDGDPRWRVPRDEVDAKLCDVFATFDVAELVLDVFGWRSEAESWSARWPGRVLEMPMNAARMGPATDRAYVAIAEGKLTHDGDRRLARHVGNSIAKRTSMGDVLSKDHRESPRRIDAAVAMVLAVELAAWHAAHPRRRARVASF